SRRDLAGVSELFLEGEELVDQRLDRENVLLLYWTATGVEVILLREILVEGALRIVPWAEVDHAALDLLGPALGRVRKEGEIRVGLLRLGDLAASPGTGRIGHGGCSFWHLPSPRDVCASPGAFLKDRHPQRVS